MQFVLRSLFRFFKGLNLLFLLVWAQQGWGSIVINEILLDNFSSIKTKQGNYYAWVELYNTSNTAVQLENWSLSDTLQTPEKWKFPKISIAPKGFILVYLSGSAEASQGELHASFTLPKKDARLFLFNPQSQLIHLVGPISLHTDVSFAFVPDGSTQGGTYKPSSPKKTNHAMHSWTPFFQKMAIHPASGHYKQDTLEAILQTSDPFVQIRYTLDGSDPSMQSALFEGSLLLTKEHVIMPHLSYIPSTPPTTKRGSDFAWKGPKIDPQTAVFIKCQGFKNGKPVTPIKSATYFIGSTAYPHNLPTFSLSTSVASLFGDTFGIYVPGIRTDNNPQPNWFLSGGNFHESGPEWERELEVQFLDESGQFQFEQYMGVRIHGYGSRSYPQKSLRLYAREMYDRDWVNFPVFPHANQQLFKHLLLRSASQDAIRTMFSDALSCSFYEGLGFDYQLHRPVVHYINGEYFGIANLRERIHHRMIASKHGLNHEDIILIEPFVNSQDGGDPEYGKLLAYVESNDMNTPEATQTLYEKIHIPSYIHYTLCKMIIGAFDWPGNNLRIWRENKANYQFRWIMFDSDEAFSTPPQKNTLVHALQETGSHWPNPDWSTLLLRRLLTNDSIKNEFIRSTEFLMTQVFTTERMIRHIDSFQKMYENEIERHINRWQMIPSKFIWERTIESYRTFARLRPCHLKSHFTDYFSLDFDSFLPHISCDSLLLEAAELEILGNPGYEHLEIKVKVESEQDVYIRIYQPNGQLVFETVRFAIAGQNIYPLEITTPTTPGLYFISVTGKKFKTGGKWLRNES